MRFHAIELAYDPEADAAYIRLRSEFDAGGVVRSYLCDPVEVGGVINLDFDAGGRLLGIEVMDASKRLPKDVLDQDTSAP